ncbi:hypothetical protein JAAARDRAFT_187387 [Jaapia argillacea MUCL 33604]|uniref:Uncharacterized protein n=1 Tax=Jaapia argillacea MUCL 33604 TaxID=933084 RepID=A0A067QKH5_9AGAM|nr:hypothetical protein JAAARDRAFT_187387 [Jaapia argillacea MUCL 33604]
MASVSSEILIQTFSDLELSLAGTGKLIFPQHELLDSTRLMKVPFKGPTIGIFMQWQHEAIELLTKIACDESYIWNRGMDADDSSEYVKYLENFIQQVSIKMFELKGIASLWDAEWGRLKHK